MGFFRKKYQVKPNTVGYLYRNNTFERILTSGYYKVWDWKKRTELFVLSEASKLLTVTNQEVLIFSSIHLFHNRKTLESIFS